MQFEDGAEKELLSGRAYYALVDPKDHFGLNSNRDMMRAYPEDHIYFHPEEEDGDMNEEKKEETP